MGVPDLSKQLVLATILAVFTPSSIFAQYIHQKAPAIVLGERSMPNSGEMSNDKAVEIISLVAGEALAALKLHPSARAKSFQELLERYGDTDQIARTAVGDEIWQSLTAGERENVSEAYIKLMAEQTALLFNGYGGEILDVMDVRPLALEARLVETVMRSNDNDGMTLGWAVSKEGQLYNLYLDGYSTIEHDRPFLQEAYKRSGSISTFIRMLDEPSDIYP